MGKRTHRFPLLANCLGGVYLIWSLLVYFGTLGHEGHDWWPIWLYFIIWPLSLLIERMDDVICPRGGMLNDYVVGALYILLGTVWIWFIGWLVSVVVKKLVNQRNA